MDIRDADLSDLAGRLAGAVLRPTDPAYDDTRRWLVGGFDDVQPRVVARCAGAADVATALAFAHRHELPFAIRSGGHSFADFSTTDGLLLDLGGMDSVSFDPTGAGRTQVVRVGPGLRVGALAERLAGHGWLVPVGWSDSVGTGGLVLGGGFGPFTRQFGLACDHLEAAEVVLADGRIVWTDANREPELFWALRGGGGGNFAVVTSMVLRARPSPPVVTFAAWWPLAHALELVDAWQHRAPAAPDEENVELVLGSPADVSQPGYGVLLGVIVGGDEAQGHGWIDELAAAVGAGPDRRSVVALDPADAPLRRLHAGPQVGQVQVTGRPPHVTAGTRLLRSDFFARPLPRHAVATLLDRFTAERIQGERRELEFVAWGGAPGTVAPDGTAFVHRRARCMMQATVINFADPDIRVASYERVVGLREALHPWATGGVYPNYPDPDLVDAPRAYFGENLPRLRRVKATYDPDNVFRFPHAVPLPDPTATAAPPTITSADPRGLRLMGDRLT